MANDGLTFGDKLMIICDNCDTMNDWEMEFIDAMELKRSKDGLFSVAERDKIEEIFEEKMI